MQLVRVEGLPDDPLAAAARFHAEVVPTLPGAGDVLLVFPPPNIPIAAGVRRRSGRWAARSRRAGSTRLPAITKRGSPLRALIWRRLKA